MLHLISKIIPPKWKEEIVRALSDFVSDSTRPIFDEIRKTQLEVGKLQKVVSDNVEENQRLHQDALARIENLELERGKIQELIHDVRERWQLFEQNQEQLASREGELRTIVAGFADEYYRQSQDMLKRLEDLQTGLSESLQVESIDKGRLQEIVSRLAGQGDQFHVRLQLQEQALRDVVAATISRK